MQSPTRNLQADAKQALWAAAGLIVLLTLAKAMGASPLLQKIGFTLVAAYQLYLPLWIMDRRRERPYDYGLHMHGSVAAPLAWLRRRALQAASRAPIGALSRRAGLGLSRLLAPYAHHAHFDPQGFRRDVGFVGVLIALTFPAFAVGHHFWQVGLAALRGRSAEYHFALPDNFAEMALINLLLVALPEELFYRGFVQTRLVRAWPPWMVRFGVPIGWAIIVSSAFFAFGHYTGEWGNPARLGPFFPALLFSAMRARSGSIMGAVLFHGLSNIFSETLRAGYTFH